MTQIFTRPENVSEVVWDLFKPASKLKDMRKSIPKSVLASIYAGLYHIVVYSMLYGLFFHTNLTLISWLFYLVLIGVEVISGIGTFAIMFKEKYKYKIANTFVTETSTLFREVPIYWFLITYDFELLAVAHFITTLGILVTFPLKRGRMRMFKAYKKHLESLKEHAEDVIEAQFVDEPITTDLQVPEHLRNKWR